MASDIWLRTILIVREETRCRHLGYSFRLAARVLLYAPSHRQDSTYHGLCYTSRGAQAGTRNSSMGPPHEGSIRRPIAPWANALPLSYVPLLGQSECRSETTCSFVNPDPNLFCLGRKGWPRSELACATNVSYSSLLWTCTLNPISGSSSSTRNSSILYLGLNHSKLYTTITLRSEMWLRGKSVRSWCDGSSDRFFMGWTHWAISRSSQCSTTGVTKAVVCAILSVGWCI